MKKHKDRANTTFKSFLLSYIFLVAVVSVSFSPIYKMTLNGVRENALKDNQAILNNKVTVIDSQLLYLQNIAFSLRNNINFSYLSQVREESVPIPYYLYLRTANEHMRNVLFQPEITNKIFFVYRNNSVCISKGIATDDINKNYTQLLDFKDMNAEEWQTFIQYENEPIFKPEAYISADNRNKITSKDELYEPVITYIVPTNSYVNNSLSRSDSALVSLIDVRELKKLLYEDNSNYKYLCLVDRYQNVLCSFGEDKIDDLAELDEKTLTLIWSDETSSGIRLVAAATNSMFSRQNQLITIPVTMFFVMSVLIGVLFSIYLSYRNNIPIKKMQRVLQSIQLSSDSQSVGDFNKMLSDLNNIKQRNRDQVFKLQEMTQMSLFDKLINQTSFDENEIAMINKHLNFLQQPFVVAVIKLDGNILQAVDENTDIYSQTLGVIFAEIASEILSNAKYLHNVLGQKLVMLISVQQSDNWREAIGIELQMICNKVKQTTAHEVMIGVSTIGNGYEQVYTCYEQAWCTLRLKLYTKALPIVFYQDSEIKECDLKINEMQKLYNLILAGDVSETEKMIVDIYQKLLDLTSIKESILSRVYYSIQNTLFFASNSLPSEVEFSFNNLSYSTELTVRELFDSLRFNASILCNTFNQCKKGTRSKERFEEYIALHFNDCNLSAAMIAEHFNLSEKYIFAVIKGIMGKSVGEYIEQVRMNHAMQLMRESKMTISEISLRCGFYSANTFSKAFKRYSGISPGKWRVDQAANG